MTIQPLSKDVCCIDAHTHTQFAVYDADRVAVLDRARAAKVALVNVGTALETSRAAVALAHEHPGWCYATIGLHPTHTVSDAHHDSDEQTAVINAERFDPEKYRTFALDPSVIAVGECGLDYFRVTDAVAQRAQREAFMAQISFAYKIKKPLMIHCRAAFDDLIAILEASRNELLPFPGVIHFFTGTVTEAHRLLNLGFSFTFGGAITYPYKQGKTVDYAELIRTLPIDRILVETDAPYVAPVPYRGKRNEPAYVMSVVQSVAKIRSISENDLCRKLVRNTARVFGIALSHE